MTAPLEERLALLDLYEPQLADDLRRSPRLQPLLAGRAHLLAWDTSSLTYLYNPVNGAGVELLVTALRLPESLQTAVLRREQSGRNSYYWNWEFTDRVEGLRLEDRMLEFRLATRRGPQRLQITLPPLPDAQRPAALEWLSQPATLRRLAQGELLDVVVAERLGLIPAWETCEIAASARTRDMLELGLQFLCRALLVHAAFLPILRGLGGEQIWRQCVERELARRQTDFDAAAAALPTEAADFWRAAPLPEVPAPHTVIPEAGLGAHLPPAAFWAKAEDNQLLAEALAKVYKNVPRKLARLTEPRRLY